MNKRELSPREARMFRKNFLKCRRSIAWTQKQTAAHFSMRSDKLSELERGLYFPPNWAEIVRNWAFLLNRRFTNRNFVKPGFKVAAFPRFFEPWEKSAILWTLTDKMNALGKASVELSVPLKESVQAWSRLCRDFDWLPPTTDEIADYVKSNRLINDLCDKWFE